MTGDATPTESMPAWLSAANDGASILNHDPGYDGCCPCFSIDEPDLKVAGHCWRTWYGDCGCEFAGVHVWGSAAAGERIVALLNEIGDCEWALVMESGPR